MQRSGSQDILFNTVMMMRMRSTRAVLLTESDRDTDLYRKFVDENRCLVRSAGNRDDVIKMLQRFADNRVVGVVGIIDADSDYVLSRSRPLSNVAITHCSDKETTIIDSAGFDLFCNSLNPSLDAATVRQEIYAAALPLGMARRISAREGWNLDFKPIAIRHFIDANAYCDKARCSEHIVAANPHLGISAQNIQECFDDEMSARLPPPRIVQGHDLVDVLALRSQSLFGIPLTAIEIEDKLSDAYSKQDFMGTTTYSEVKSIESSWPSHFSCF